MTDAVHRLRLSRVQLVVLAALSTGASVVIITLALGRTSAQKAALAALARAPVEVRIAAAARPASQPVGSTSAASTTSAAPASPSSTAVTPASMSPSSTTPALATPSSTPPASTTSASTTTPTPAAAKHTVGHVFVVALSTTSFAAAFGKGSVAHYLNHKLRRQGTLLGGYESLGAGELPDYLAMVSGQAPNPATRAQCTSYTEFVTGAKPRSNGQVSGTGCVYPNTIITVGDQATASGHTWKAFIDDMQPSTCVHPNSNAIDNGALPGTGSQYATRHNPFIYFHSLLDLGGCSANDLPLTRLPRALGSRSRTPSYTFLSPRACDDAAATGCPDGAPAGLAGEDAFLKRWVPKIRRSAAYRKNGVLIVAFALTGTAATAGRTAPTGALVLSRYASPGATIGAPYNPYSLLRSSETLLGYTPLARAHNAKSFVASALPKLT